MIEILGDLGDFIGGVAVVGSLIYLAVQIRNNTRSNQSQALAQWTNFASLTNDHVIRDREFVEIMFERFASEKWDPADPDTVRIGMWLVQMYTNLQTIYYLVENGTIGKEFIEAQIPYVETVMSQPGVKTWWSTEGRRTFTPQFVTFIESHGS